MDLPLPYTENKKDYYIQRALEIFPGVLTWLTFFLMIFLSVVKPIWVAIFIIIFDVFWICKGIFIAIHIIKGYGMMKRNIAVNWLDRIKGVSEGFDSYYKRVNSDYKKFLRETKKGINPKYFSIKENKIVRLRSSLGIGKQKEIFRSHINELEQIKSNPERKKSILKWDEIEHVVIIATYKEPVEVLAGNVEAIMKSNYPNDKIRIFIGFEERAKWEGDEEMDKKRKILEEKYKSKFAHFETTVHPFLENEKPGCGSNETWVAKVAKKHLDKEGISYKKTILTSFDAEAYAHEEYFGAITWYFMTTKERTRRAYQPLPFYSNTIWYAPGYSRLISMGSTFWHMVESIRSERLVTFSNQSHSFQAIVDANYWPVNYVVNDDSVIFWRCYFKYEGDYETIPVYIPVSQDAVYAGKFWPTFKASYKQRRRWAYGIEHFAPMVRAFLKTKKIPLYEKFKHVYIIIESNHSLATNAIMLAVLGWLPLLLGGSEFNQQVIARNLPFITRTLLTSSMIFLLISIYLGFILVPPRPKNMPWWKNIGFLYQWLLVIIMATILGSVPAVEAQTRLMLGKYMGYDTTPKKREFESTS